MPQKSLLEPKVQQEILDRINTLARDTQAHWGEMDVAQMMAHCAEVQEVMNGKSLEGTPVMVKLFKGMIRKVVMSETPYQKSLRTHPQYVIADERSFEGEKERLIKALVNFANLTVSERRQLNHPLFGKMTDEELGWAAYKHVDHHLQQFGV